jgi:hypothetical protein
MSDVDTTAKLIQQLEADYYSHQTYSNDVDDGVKAAAKKVRHIMQEYGLEAETVNDMLLTPEDTTLYYDVPAEVVDQVFQATDNLDPFEIQKLSTLVA